MYSRHNIKATFNRSLDKDLIYIRLKMRKVSPFCTAHKQLCTWMLRGIYLLTISWFECIQLVVVLCIHICSSNILLHGRSMSRLATLARPKKRPLLSKRKSSVKVMKDVKQLAGYQDPEYLREEMGPKLETYSFGVVSKLYSVIQLNVTNTCTCSNTLLGSSQNIQCAACV